MKLIGPAVLVLAACVLLAGCTAPLGYTSYPRANMNSVQGTWEATFEPTRDDGDSKTNATRIPNEEYRMILDVRRMGAAPGAVIEDDAAEREEAHAMANSGHLYVVTVRFEELGGARASSAPARSSSPLQTVMELEPIEVEGEFIRTRRWTLFTFQRSLKHWDWTGLSTSVQRTVRVRLVEGEGGEPDRLVVDEPKRQFVYVPIAMAGELDFRRPYLDGESTSLVQNLDDAFATLDRATDKDWKPLGVFVRTGR